MTLGRGKRCPAFWDVAKGRNGCYLDFEKTNDPKWINVIWQEVNSMRSQKIFNVPAGSLKFLDPASSECPEMYKHGIVVMMAGENGEAPLRDVIAKEIATTILAKNQEIERLKGKAVASQIRESRAVVDVKTHLKDHADIRGIMGPGGQPGEEGSGSPYIRRPRLGEE